MLIPIAIGMSKHIQTHFTRRGTQSKYTQRAAEIFRHVELVETYSYSILHFTLCKGYTLYTPCFVLNYWFTGLFVEICSAFWPPPCGAAWVADFTNSSSWLRFSAERFCTISSVNTCSFTVIVLL